MFWVLISWGRRYWLLWCCEAWWHERGPWALKRVYTCRQELTAQCGQSAHGEWLFSNQHAARSTFCFPLVGNLTSGMLCAGCDQGMCVKGWRGGRDLRSPWPHGHDSWFTWNQWTRHTLVGTWAVFSHKGVGYVRNLQAYGLQQLDTWGLLPTTLTVVWSLCKLWICMAVKGFFNK